MKQWLTFSLVPFLLQLFVRFVYLTSKKRFHYPQHIPTKPCIIAMWHGELLMQPHNYRKLKPKGLIKVIVSIHKDGRIISKICEHLGVGSIDGSSSKGGAKALINAIKQIKNGVDVAITPDGPRGPRHSVADGIIAIAQKTNCDIISLNIQASSYWRFKSWDHFIVPKPFGTIDFYASKPYNITNLNFDQAKELIKTTMMEKALL
ncbi:MAG: lysophospholipid acyltransferase family protein [Campylobacterota bacterium]|nr:lysophospholipid acyltransferase family protein [Campylobacterota bacterium]